MTKNLLMDAAGAVLTACAGSERTTADSPDAAAPARGYGLPASDVAMTLYAGVDD